MSHDEKSRIPISVAQRLLAASQERLAATTAPRTLRGFVDDARGDAPTTRRRRIELLDMNVDDDIRRWQIVHNDAERYAVVSEKFTTVRGEDSVDYRCLLVYVELGEDLPLYKTVAELRMYDATRSAHTAGGSSEIEPDFSDLDKDGS